MTLRIGLGLVLSFDMQFSDKEIEQLIDDIYNDVVSIESLPENLYLAIGRYLESGLYRGFGGSILEFEGTRLELLQSLRTNVWLFSGAKTYQTVEAMGAMTNDNGSLRTFKEFKEFAAKEFDLINKTWAKTEYETAIGQAQNAEKWQTIESQKKLFPRLRYSAVMDANTSEICAPLNGLVFDVDDPEVDVISPENHPNCRCLWEQETEDVDVSDNRSEVAGKVSDEMSDAWKFNPGKSQEIFSKDHPYFDVPKDVLPLARENFGFEIPEE